MMLRYLLAFVLIVAMAGAAVPTRAGEEAAGPVRVLIVTGNDYPGHKWRETTPMVRQALEAAPGRFAVRVVEDPEIMATRLADRYDVVVLHFCNWETPSPSRAALDGLAGFVRQGGGLVALHFACGAFLDWPEYEKLIGRVWDQSKTHDPYGTFTVNVKKEHPITRGLADFETSDELYFCLKGAPAIEVLLTARSTMTKQDEPMGFTLPYGRGRVFHTPLGHDVKSFAAPGVARLLQNACAWAAGRS